MECYTLGLTGSLVTLALFGFVLYVGIEGVSGHVGGFLFFSTTLGLSTESKEFWS